MCAIPMLDMACGVYQGSTFGELSIEAYEEQATIRKGSKNGKEEGYDIDCGRKREWKERFAENLRDGSRRKPYLHRNDARPMDNECLARIEKHRGMRAQKNFQTVECYTGLKQVRVPKDSVLLLECMSNLTANEIYAPEGRQERIGAAKKFWHKALENQCRHLIIVSNEVLRQGQSMIRLRCGIWISSEKSTGNCKNGGCPSVEITAGCWIWHKQGGKINDFDSDRGIFDVFGNSMPQTEWTNKVCVVRVPADRRSDRCAGVPVAFYYCLRMEFSEWILAAGICVLPGA